MNSLKNTPYFIIYKLLLNTLYGIFGMNPEVANHLIIPNNESLKYHNNKTITNVIDLEIGKELISFFDEKDCNEENKSNLNNSIPI